MPLPIGQGQGQGQGQGWTDSIRDIIKIERLATLSLNKKLF
jgi:hypothetical protein